MKVEQKKIHTLKEIWNGLYLLNPQLSPYQSFEFQSIIGKGWADKRPWIGLQLRELTLLVTENDIPVAIAPFIVKKSRGKIVDIFLRGAFSSAAHLDFIYGKLWEINVFKAIMDFVISIYPSCNFHFGRISEKSLSNMYIREYFSLTEKDYSSEKCASIPIPSDFNEYFGTLSKKTRGNVRSSYNRLEKNGLKQKLVTYYYSPIPTKQYMRMLMLYTSLLERKNNISGFFQYLLKPIIFLGKHFNPMSKALRTLSTGFHSLLYINGKVAACFWGLMCNDNRLILSRFSDDHKYGWYSPGGMMIIELVKELIEKHDTLKIDQLDLARGTENYKFVYGAVEYLNYHYNIEHKTNKLGG